MFRVEVDPKLPQEPERLRDRLTVLHKDIARTVRQVQSPPVARVTHSADQSLGAGVVTALAWNTETWDSHGYFASNRFTPKDFAGYYRFTARVSFKPNATGNPNACAVTVRKNGAAYAYAEDSQPSTARLVLVVSDVAYLNGATDYLDVTGTSAAARDVESAYSAFTVEYLGAEQIR